LPKKIKVFVVKDSKKWYDIIVDKKKLSRSVEK